MSSGRVSTIIAGVGYYLPNTIVKSEDINKRVGLKGLNLGAMLESVTGVRERRYASPGTDSSDLAAEASRRALKNAGIGPEEIDTLIFASVSADLPEPATANILQAKLGAFNSSVFDVRNTCNSVLTAIDIIDSFISSGRSRIALIASGEVCSKFINWNIGSLRELKKNFAAFSLGDGGGALVLRRSEETTRRGIIASRFQSDGSKWELSVIRGFGTMSPRNPGDSYFQADSLALNRLALKHIPMVIGQVLKISGWTAADVDLVIPHQVSESIIRKICGKIKIPFEKVLVCLDKYGNCAAASIPIALGQAMSEGRVREGDKLILVGGAAGWSAGAISLVM